jgi:hypothetical protein
VEANVELAILDLVGRLEVKVLERVQEDLLTSNVELDRGVSDTILGAASMHSTREVVALVVKLEHLGVLGQNIECAIEKLGVIAHKVIQNLAVVLGEREEQLLNAGVWLRSADCKFL